MKKTLLLVFIHGFKGDDDTFGEFPDHLRVLMARSLPAVQVATAVYPKYQTRGELKECVGMFREWLQNKVIDLEVENRTASPTVDPSVHVFLIGHSMGGIVAAETLLLLASEQPIPTKSAADISTDPTATNSLADSGTAVGAGSFMFPHIQGIVAFDTPFLGIAPGVVSYGAEGQYRNVTSAYTALSEAAGLFGLGGGSSSHKSASSGQGNDSNKQLPPSAPSTSSATDAAATPSWQRWGRYAMFAGAAGALAAGGAAAMYSQRDRLTDGLGWVSSHLAFVGCLARAPELRQRLALLSEAQQERGVGCTNFYTCLGQGASSLVENNKSGTSSFSQKIIRSKNRTFCSLPAEVESGASHRDIRWVRAVNDKAADEIKAHVSMFLLKENPAFYSLVTDACQLLVESVDKGWYATATGPIEEVNEDMQPQAEAVRAEGQTDSGFMDGEDVVVVE
ncbi:hypothetical protein BO70DRAFT_64846 [Aspergillus heteromorphus CBS 117.55]|uniref:DUF676 domain-containing protein n=1 Tax=Aspergillus heteromorphus CBS 117.55 TaxID=1448321 RepID=A0A317VZP9_9EURO|nr:uncharacterized protein BO70DRAFT_64846 [Aspergillus heteromorphus CBS 117.55]PWY77370.1 hypothetical protein BO70DRAFT_64846 [Aspergillus heteromorphus CBS 117.55]